MDRHRGRGVVLEDLGDAVALLGSDEDDDDDSGDERGRGVGAGVGTAVVISGVAGSRADRDDGIVSCEEGVVAGGDKGNEDGSDDDNDDDGAGHQLEDDPKHNSFWSASVPRNRRPSKAWVSAAYFLLLFSLGSTLSFMPVFYRDFQGLTYNQVGLLGVIVPLAQFVASPLWSLLADVTGNTHLVLIAAASLTIGSQTLFLAVKGFDQVCLVILFNALSFAGILPMVDSAVLKLLHDPLNWGKLRLWGAAGFGSAVLVSGGLLQAMDEFWPLILQGSSTLIAAVIVCCAQVPFGMLAMAADDDEVPKSKTNHRQPTFFDGARVMLGLFATAPQLTFFIVVLVSGYCMGVIENFLFLFLENIGAHSNLLGLSRSVTCAAEVPIFLVAGGIIRNITTQGVMAVAFLAYTIRLVAYSLLGDPWVVLAVEPLHGVTFALLWAACTNYAHEVAPRHYHATTVGLVNGVRTLGQAVGALLGGHMATARGFRFTFAVSSGVSGIAVALVIVQHLIARNHRAYQKLDAERGMELNVLNLGRKGHDNSSGDCSEEEVVVEGEEWRHEEQMGDVAHADGARVDEAERVGQEGRRLEDETGDVAAHADGDRVDDAE
eukprot:m.23311 g.23311  ORF g.23311 m.23311 type:complete len:605 (-) comp7128_c0_seq2:291-2105(-)